MNTQGTAINLHIVIYQNNIPESLLNAAANVLANWPGGVCIKSSTFNC